VTKYAKFVKSNFFIITDDDEDEYFLLHLYK